jgi:hypothetical protein
MRPSAVFAMILLSAGLASAGTIVSVAGTPGTGYFLGGSGPDQVLVSSWTQTGSYMNVSISAELGNSSNYGNSGGDAISVYLTNQIGPGTTVANQIASTSVSPATVDETDTLFTGLSLGAGTYYLVLGAPGQFAEWYGTGSPTVTTDSGVTGNFDSFADKPSNTPNDSFPPASNFDSNPADNNNNLLMTVTGNAVSAAPEPSTIVLAGLAGAFLFCAKSRFSR